MSRNIPNIRKEEIKKTKLQLRTEFEDFYQYRRDVSPSLDPISGLVLDGAARLSEDKLNLETSHGVSVPIHEMFQVYTKIKQGTVIKEHKFTNLDFYISSIYSKDNTMYISITEEQLPSTIALDDIEFALMEANYSI